MEDKEDERKKKLKCEVAGENVDWEMFERYMAKAKPITLSTLVKAIRVESYLAATKGNIQMSSGMKWAIVLLVVGVIVMVAVWFLFFQPGSTPIPLINGSVL